MSLLRTLNEKYLELHEAKENAFWAARMRLRDYVPGDYEKKESRLKAFVSDPTQAATLRTELKRTDLTAVQRQGLEGWLRFFEVNAIESEEAKRLQDATLEKEGILDRARREMRLGYLTPDKQEFREAPSEVLRLMLANDPDERRREAAWRGMRTIESFVLANGFLEIVKERNRFARMLGYEDYYDYKVTLYEGFSKRKLFELLDELERDTRESCRKSVNRLVVEKGRSAVEPWNFDYLTSGDLTARFDPYLKFESALGRWGRSFAAMGIRYSGATLTLDLVARRGKSENGFMHGPFPAYIDEGRLRPARINFTSNALPTQMGSGYKALETLFHEGGHAAHFSNIRMPAPCFAQEFAPTSVAFAETQSMFCDSVAEDADWRKRYALSARGEAIPDALLEQAQLTAHTYRALKLRSLLLVPYAEKALYEMKDPELSSSRVLDTFREIERSFLCLSSSPRPVLSIPHLLANESSAYYHGYVLAQMAVYQTRDYFLKKYEHIVDNPHIGRDLEEKYWAPGNSRGFLELVKELTGEPFSAAATVRLVNRSHEDVSRATRSALAHEREIPAFTGPVELGAKISLVHGDELVATNARGETLDAMERQFAAWLSSMTG